jgi:hypothetical protein
MKRTLLVVFSSVLMLGSAGAGAHAYADVTFAGMDLGMAGSGANFNGFTVGRPLDGGETWSASFDYSVTLHNDGLPAPLPVDPVCTPLHFSVCSPPDVGVEYAVFDFGVVGNQYQSGFYEYSVSGLPIVGSFTAAPGTTVTYSGSFTVTETVTSSTPPPFESVDQDVLYGVSFVDDSGAAPVPEPPALGLIVAGAALLLVRRSAVRPPLSARPRART